MTVYAAPEPRAWRARPGDRWRDLAGFCQAGEQPMCGPDNHRTGPASVYGATGMRGACYVTFFAFFGVFAFFAFARCGVVGAAALVLVSPGATAPPGAGAVTWPAVPARAGPPELWPV